MSDIPKNLKKNIVGHRFHRLKVLRYTGGKRGQHYEVECVCDCGAMIKTATTNLISGHTKSCGCMRGKHRMSFSQEYTAWKQMRNRCHNPHDRSYRNYGARGITVCTRWIDSFENFFADMGRKPSPQHSLDRINVNGNYDPENCVWADIHVQSRNKRTQPSATGVKGVHPMPNGITYKATIHVHNKSIYLGVYPTIEAAAQARRQAEIKYWGAHYVG